MSLSFSKKFMKRALEANGWHTLWHPDNWVPPKASNPDWAGMNIQDAFCSLLVKKLGCGPYEPGDVSGTL